ncbi:MAG: glycine betaine/L-proline ABC transporter ATP-binding protein [Pseudomonadota bacterium]|nr:glycine betaine/L-proline ABC transporter ATP-binding protein [Pseudomonadota bacterium]
MSEPKLVIKSLYKIFGLSSKNFVSAVRDGMSKQELLDKHNHVLGLKDINLEIPEQKIQVIMGLSGSGKSTLIRHVNRLIEPTVGELIVEGEDILSMSQVQLREFRRKKTSMVFQKFALLPHKTVSQNVAYGLTIQGVKEDVAKQQSHQWIDRVGLGGFEERYPAQLSGGMQQRVGLARALATDAPILLMDEAFSALDPLIRTDMQDILLGLQQELHKTIIFITHDLDEALRIGDNIAILRDGEIVQKGDPQEIIMRPADDYITDFIKDINRARVIKLKSIMSKSVSAGKDRLGMETNLEEALPIINSSKDKKCGVVDKQDKLVGSVSLDSALKALTRPTSIKVGERYK